MFNSSYSSTQFLLTLASERCTIFYIGRKPGHICIIKQLYSRYAYIAFRENLHVSMEAQLMLNKFEVYKTLCIQVKTIKKKDEDKTKAQSRKQNCYFCMHICNMTSLVTP